MARNTTSIQQRNSKLRTSKYSAMFGTGEYFYTKGKEFTTIDGEEYIGEYHIQKNGTVLTGAVEKFGSGKVLLPYYSNHDHYVYDKQFSFFPRPKTFAQPVPYVYTPREAEGVYVDGFDFRYFVQRRNSDSFAIEIDGDQYNRIGKSSGIDDSIYAYVAVKWRLTGTLQLIETENKVAVNRASLEIPTITYSISNYTQFARPTTQTAVNNEDSYYLQSKFKNNAIPLKQTYDRATGRIIPVQ
jgi:hypothetical protein